jgi:YesN/AraC family two-component response regulator
VKGNDVRMSLFQLEHSKLHHDIFFEQQVMDAITKGDVDELKISFRAFPTAHAGMLSQHNKVRSLKNLVITTIAVAIRAAIKGGIHYEVAYSWSDGYIQRVEELNDEQRLIKYLEAVLLELAHHVQARLAEQYSKPVYACVSYIQLHLHEQITLEQLARIVQLHPKYVSYLFQKELGVSFSVYVQHMRIKEAEKLLLFSSYSIGLISEHLHFYDQSHFTKTFKRITGYTPREYQLNQVKC